MPVEKFVKFTFKGGHPTLGFAANNALLFDIDTIPSFNSLLEHPVDPQHLSRTSYVPLPVYVWLGFVAVDIVPSPKVHLQESKLVDRFVKLTVNGEQPVAEV